MNILFYRFNNIYESDVISSDNFYNYINEELRLVEVDRRSFSFKYKDEYKLFQIISNNSKKIYTFKQIFLKNL